MTRVRCRGAAGSDHAVVVECDALATYTVFKDHSHLSQSYSVRTTDPSVKAVRSLTSYGRRSELASMLVCQQRAEPGGSLAVARMPAVGAFETLNPTGKNAS